MICPVINYGYIYLYDSCPLMAGHIVFLLFFESYDA